MQSTTIHEADLNNAIKDACKRIAPVWPLDRFVAVNPYLGHAETSFSLTADRLRKTGQIEMTLPAAYYLGKLEEGQITEADLRYALKEKGNEKGLVQNYIQKLKKSTSGNKSIYPTIAEIAGPLTEKDWNRLFNQRISSWAASYFDQGQSIWNTTAKNEEIFKAWRLDATIDRTLELTGLKGFRSWIKSVPENAQEAIAYTLNIIDLPSSGLESYFERLLRQIGGWSAHVARLDWEARLDGKLANKLEEMLAICLTMEAALLQLSRVLTLGHNWNEAKKAYLKPAKSRIESEDLALRLVLQDAYDHAEQRRIIDKMKQSGNTKTNPIATKAQAVFCIDVRSEVYRRNLEIVDAAYKTMGFAGFFGFPINFKPVGEETSRPQCPVLLKPAVAIEEELSIAEDTTRVARKRKIKHAAKRIWKRYKSGAVSSFSFVSPLGITFLPKLLSDGFNLTRPVPHPETIGMKEQDLKQKAVKFGPLENISIEQQAAMAKNALTAMSLTENFAPVVMLVGHGSQSVNNPHATGLDCGACGGHTGEANARIAATVFNNKLVRAILKENGIEIPEKTVFLASLHDTTTDEVHILEEHLMEGRKDELSQLKSDLAKAGIKAREERALRMAITSAPSMDKAVLQRSKDWSQVRPEWGLAGCSSFIVAPRERTLDKDLQGRSFLHTYDWKSDKNFGVLELIMTAPMVVTSWINLQYYASTVDNKHLGAGNKTLHNVTAGLGVLEGAGGDLRVGLPWQSVHDGENYQHEPLRLNVIIEAPIKAMNDILAKHQSVKDLCDNQWIFLLAMDEKGQVSHRYAGNLNWEELSY